jgi:hypothetical protein
MSAKVTRIQDSITSRLDGMLDRAKSIRTFLDRNIYHMYQDVQRERWMTQNKSEGTEWTKLSPSYAKFKLKKFAQYPGGGSKMMIATNKLFKSVIGPGEGFKKVVEDRSITISTSIPYAVHADAARTFTTYSPETQQRFRKAVAQYVFNNFLFDIQRIT